MREMCNECYLRSSVEKWRQRLDIMIIKKKGNFLDDEIIAFNQYVGDLIAECIDCNAFKFYKAGRRNTIVGNKQRDLYYYGECNLFINLYDYIEEGIRNNEKVYISIQKNLYKKLKSLLMINGISIEKVQFICIEDMKRIIRNKSSSISFSEEIKLGGNKGHEKNRWIIQSSLQKYFLQQEDYWNRYNEKFNSSILCVHDASPYIHKNTPLESGHELLNKYQYHSKKEIYQVGI
ncbi:hypothetical protein [Clostridium beijerinckii]|nr:hypothetical protein [Clostridium beijerinckii]NRT34667.1 hypothetical protein [Clostridium beijerinckii]NRT45904.1 hypothetical protein [Clostridium beijerinckii]NRT71279.1 hypothetical protein [Clostridium beijerinckii]NRZ20095.1 hypothetical protein [Clostridium beijerinckii]